MIAGDSDRLQTELLGIAAKGCDQELLSLLVSHDWRADRLKTERRDDAWFGSIAMLKAAQNGLIDHVAVLDRIAPKYYGQAAKMLNSEAQQEISHRIDACIQQLLRVDERHITPDIDIELNRQSDNADLPWQFSINQKTSNLGVSEVFQQINQSIEDFQEQQKRNELAFFEFKLTLSRSKASIILDGFTLEQFALIVAANEQTADMWWHAFIKLPTPCVPFVRNLMLLLAYALSAKQPDKSIQIFNKLRNSKSAIRVTFGSAGIELSSLAVWSAKNPALDDERTYRLDSTGTDHELALEVLCALKNKQQTFLERYINQKLLRKEPSEVARGLMVAGFSDVSEVNLNILKRFENTAGMIGKASNAAKYAYERNEWARHWYQRMCETNQRDEFWQASLLLNKIVDGRFEVWRQEHERKGELIAVYGPTSGQLKNRYDRWKTHREKTLFGNQAPDTIFLQCTSV